VWCTLDLGTGAARGRHRHSHRREGLVISIYDQEPPASQLASRALNLIDAMILARTYRLEERMAQLDR